jgi:hypothetical protein
MARFFDGVIIGANLLEATPGATASLSLQFGRAGVKVYVDPVTHSFGLPLDSLRSVTSSEKKRKKRKTEGIKRSYRQLADRYGPPFVDCLKRNSELTSKDLSDGGVRQAACASVAQYQLKRMPGVFHEDEELRELEPEVPRPAAIFAPYFFINSANVTVGKKLFLDCLSDTVRLGLGPPTQGILCIDEQTLSNPALTKDLGSAIADTGAGAVWLWVSDLDELAPGAPLARFRELVEDIAKKVSVYSKHSGYFGLCLHRYGLAGISHSVGYGEHRNIQPVLGQSVPTVNYYLPRVHRRLSVPEIQRSFAELGVHSVSDFHAKICSCVICKGVVTTSLADFIRFGDQHYSNPEATRQVQTPSAAKRCRYHFLFKRLEERDTVSRLATPELIKNLRATQQDYLGIKTLDATKLVHLENWIQALQ